MRSLGTHRHERDPSVGARLRLAWLLWAGAAMVGCHPRQVTPVILSPELERGSASAEAHIVQPGETLWRIARAHGVSVSDLLRLNRLSRPQDLRVGQRLLIPQTGLSTGRGPEIVEGPAPNPRAPVVSRSSRFAWPVHGLLVSRFGIRGSEHHDGIDIAAPEGAPITAAAAGRVLFAGEQRGYGNLAQCWDHGGERRPRSMRIAKRSWLRRGSDRPSGTTHRSGGSHRSGHRSASAL